MAEDTDNDQVTVIVGISKRQTDLENIHTACTQARHTVRAYRRRQINCVEFYKENYEVKNSSFHSDTMQKLYDMLLSANESSIQKLSADIQKESHIQPELYEFRKTEIYYGFLFTIHSACQQLELPIKDHDTEQDLNDLSLEQCLNCLLQICIEICKKADSKKDQKKEDQKQQLVAYLEHNFSRPELNAIMASEELGISEKYLYALLKEQTGCFPKCLSKEQKRINKTRDFMHFGMISRVFAWRWDNFPKMGYAKYWICGCFSNLNVYIRLEIDYDEPIKSFHVFALKAKEGEGTI